ncbi:MAG TPA: ABC transporter ATP-binding protein [Candidatus Hydrogenedens sp.]|nr:ABC transporter ATP-binding protein [Candidatus Hydrogenedens sp.]HOL18769.1 ABC transporter ATP-binding protein [Candidatus Hydrogenedens sp.]
MTDLCNADNALLHVKNLYVHFSTPTGTARAVDGLSFFIHPGEAIALVGESGCGKSVTAMSLLKLLPSPPVEKLAGEVLFHGKNLLSLSADELMKIRGRHISMIFQEPTTSMNPVFRVGDQIADVLQYHFRISKQEAYSRIEKLFEWVGIPEPHIRVRQYPHEFSGGLIQRAMIAMALACEPELLIADEPTTALDVTIQAEILALLRRIQKEKNMSLLLISHDLSVVAQIARWIVVLYAGKKVEEGSARAIYSTPVHPYTQALFDSLPIRSVTKKQLATIPGSVPSATALPTGCRFHPRCPKATKICSEKQPPWRWVSQEQGTACWLYTDSEKREREKNCYE